MASLPDGQHCRKCGEWKPFSEYRKTGRWWRSTCNACQRAWQREYQRSKEVQTKRRLAQRERQSQLPERVREQVRQRRKEWGKKNAEKLNEYQQRRREREKAGWRLLCEWFGNCCLACGATADLVPDHVRPLALGGLPDLINQQPLCGACNRRKGRKVIDYRDRERLHAFLDHLIGTLG